MKFNAAFWKWFGDSKVVDKHGEPLAVYHGATTTFTKFKEQNVIHYFTTNIEYAKCVVAERGYDIKIISAYLRIENPLNLTYIGDKKYTAERIEQSLSMKGIEFRFPDYARFDNYLEPWWAWLMIYKSKLIPAIREKGFDGIIMKETAGGCPDAGTVYVVFDPNQIKGVENDGTWDVGDPDIRSNPETESVDLETVIEHIEDTDGTGDEGWIDRLVKEVSRYHRWKVGPVKIKDIENDNSSTRSQLRPYIEMGDSDWSEVVLVPSDNPKFKWHVIDGGHRVAALEMFTKEKSIGAYYPAP